MGVSVLEGFWLWVYEFEGGGGLRAVVGRWRWRREGALSWMVAVAGLTTCMVVREVRFEAVN